MLKENTMKLSNLFVLALICMVSVGCASRTKLVAGPIAIDGKVAIHEWKDASLTLRLDRVGFTVGNVSAHVGSEITDCTEVISLDHETGMTK